jgi:hypothetical protein
MQSSLRNKLGQTIYTLDEAICEVEVYGRNNRKHRIRIWTDLDDPSRVHVDTDMPVSITPAGPQRFVMRLT